MSELTNEDMARVRLATSIANLTGLHGEVWSSVSDIASEYELADSLLAQGYVWRNSSNAAMERAVQELAELEAELRRCLASIDHASSGWCHGSGFKDHEGEPTTGTITPEQDV